MLAQVVQDIVRFETAYADPPFYKNYHPYCLVGNIQDPNIYGPRIFSESIFVGLN